MTTTVNIHKNILRRLEIRLCLQETFLANEVDGARLCDLDLNRLVKMGVHSWDDLKVRAFDSSAPLSSGSKR